MPEMVVFLGAGASKPLGLPMTADIFPLLLQHLSHQDSGREPLFGGDAIDGERLRACLNSLFPGLADFVENAENRDVWRDKLPQITDVLSLIDYLLLFSNAPTPGLTLPELKRARALIERAIFELLVRTEGAGDLPMGGVPDAVRDQWGRVGSLLLPRQRGSDEENQVSRAVDWLMSLAARNGRRVTLVSTNYDIEIEQELYTRLGYDVFAQVDFGMSVRDPDSGTVHPRPADARFRIYKLHGSLNWLRCSLCDNVYVNPIGAIAYLSFLLGEDAERRSQENPWLKVLERAGANQCHCGAKPLTHVIVAPSFVRDVRDAVLQGIWHNAFEALRQADEWIVIGYSLPPEDVAIRSMLVRAYHARDAAKPRITVVQREKKDPELTRYKLLFQDYTYETGGLRCYLERTFPPTPAR